MINQEILNRILRESQEEFILTFNKKFKNILEVFFTFCLEKDEYSKENILIFFHSLKGTGALLNFESLSLIGGKLETYLNTKESFEYEIPVEIAKGLALALLEYKKIQTEYNNIQVEKSLENPLEKPDNQNNNNLTTKEKSILLIDDDHNICNLLKEVFEEFYNFSYAESGELGIELFFKNKPDIVIVDLILPKSNGFEVCEKIRDYSPSKNTKLILLSSKNNEDTLITSFELGIDDFIPKPFNIDELLIRINRLL